MDLGVRDRAFVVFGGTRGIGFAAARALAAEGARVAVVGRDADRAADAAAALGSAIALTADLRVEGAAEKAVAAVEEQLGPLRGAAVTTGLGARGQRPLTGASDTDWT